jgi:hypothetical protein
VLDNQKGPDLPEIWPKMARKRAKYVKFKVFDTLIKIDLLVSVGNDFKLLLLCSSSSFLV